MRASFLPLVLTVAAGPLAAQMPTADSARFVITQQGRPLGTEDFAFRVGQTGTGEPAVSFVASTTAPDPLRIAVTAGARRITVRVASPTGEAAREYPGGNATLVADERVLSLYAMAAGIAPGPVTVYGPPPGGRRTGTLELGHESLPDAAGPTRHMILRSGEDVVNLWYDQNGHLLRVEIPSRGLDGERVISR
jgi:hypothetical protein